MARKEIKTTLAESNRMRELASAQGLKVSALGRQWIEDFVKNGSSFVATPEGKTSVQILLDPQLLVAAERKAQEEYGVPLSDIIRHNIAHPPKRSGSARRTSGA
ncbi:hypothetical protein SEA_FIZZLES_71 [Microbacterium phage Fizzles]|nr:hypothetical protein SEA_FIZZLES_71 [Microbacterium phage Fizzles]